MYRNTQSRSGFSVSFLYSVSYSPSQMDQKFLITFRAEDRRLDNAERLKACLHSGLFYFTDDSPMFFGVFDNSAFADFTFADFKLRLDKGHTIAVLQHHRRNRRENQF